MRLHPKHHKSKVYFELEHYNDLFSDFDPRDYPTRALSVDFIEEAERAMREREERVTLHFILPKKKRDPQAERSIKTRIKEHFTKHADRMQEEKRSTIRKGAGLFVCGIIFMAVTTYLHSINNGSYVVNFLTILFEPASWFLFWEGLNFSLFESKKQDMQLQFHQKMKNIKGIVFENE